MKLAILSRSPEIYSTSRLFASAARRGHDVRIVNHLQCSLFVTAGTPTLKCRDEDLSDFDAVLPRIGASATFYGTSVVQQFELMGIPTANRANAIAQSRDKLRCLQLLSQAGVAVPRTGYAHSAQSTDELIELVGGAPLIVKLLKGTQGTGVILAENRKAAESIIDTFKHLRTGFLVQEYVSESKAMDLRCFVVGEDVAAAIVRQGIAGEFRSNLHRGGMATVANLSAAERTLAIRAAKSVGLNIAGVDILRTSRGPVVLEINSSPGLEGVEKVTGLDVASRVIEFVESQLSYERMTTPMARVV